MSIKPFKKLFVLVTCIILISCKSNSPTQLATTYIITDTVNTSILDYRKLFPGSDKYAMGYAKNNVAVIYTYENDTLKKFSDQQLDYLPAICQAIYKNDTLLISTGIGFFAGEAVGIKVTKTGFKGGYDENADETPVYKYKLTDSNYISDINVGPISEQLILNKQPSFKNGEELTGEYNGSFQPFYEKEFSEVKLRKVRWKIVFKCTIINIGNKGNS